MVAHLIQHSCSQIADADKVHHTEIALHYVARMTYSISHYAIIANIMNEDALANQNVFFVISSFFKSFRKIKHP